MCYGHCCGNIILYICFLLNYDRYQAVIFNVACFAFYANTSTNFHILTFDLTK